MNPLRKHLADTGTTAADFAARLDVSPSFFSRILSGEREADASLIARIVAETKGAVTADAWVSWWASKAETAA